MDVKAFFEDVIRQREDRLFSYFSDDAIIRWHCSNERFTVEEYIRANCEYPESWDGQIERTKIFGDLIILAARVFPVQGDGSYHVVSFIRLKDDRIAELDEYWADDTEVPEWRKDLKIGKAIR